MVLVSMMLALSSCMPRAGCSCTDRQPSRLLRASDIDNTPKQGSKTSTGGRVSA